MTLSASDVSASVTGGTVTLKGAATNFSYPTPTAAPAGFVRDVTGSFASTGTKTGNAIFTPTGEGLTGESVQSFNVGYTAQVVGDRTLTSNNGTAGAAVDLGRIFKGTTTGTTVDLRSVNAVDLANITVNAVAPSAVRGPQLDALDDARRQALGSAIPLGRFGEPDEVAAAVVYLASPQAGYITGATLDLNGGRLMR